MMEYNTSERYSGGGPLIRELSDKSDTISLVNAHEIELVLMRIFVGNLRMMVRNEHSKPHLLPSAVISNHSPVDIP